MLSGFKHVRLSKVPAIHVGGELAIFSQNGAEAPKRESRKSVMLDVEHSDAPMLEVKPSRASFEELLHMLQAAHERELKDNLEKRTKILQAAHERELREHLEASERELREHLETSDRRLKEHLEASRHSYTCAATRSTSVHDTGPIDRQDENADETRNSAPDGGNDNKLKLSQYKENALSGSSPHEPHTEAELQKIHTAALVVDSDDLDDDILSTGTKSTATKIGVTTVVEHQEADAEARTSMEDFDDSGDIGICNKSSSSISFDPVQLDQTWLAHLDFTSLHQDDSIFDDPIVHVKMKHIVEKEWRYTSRNSTFGFNTLKGDIIRLASHANMGNHLCILHPTSKKKQMLDLLGIAFLVKDLVFVPLQIFIAKNKTIANSYDDYAIPFERIAAVFWTIDIIVSFITGYYTSEGFLELRLRHIVPRYLRTWFILDVSLILLDWLTVFLGILTDFGFLRSGKIIARFLRICRLVRFRKFNHFIKKVLERIPSEYTQTFWEVCQVMVLIIILNHYIACGWYGLTRLAGVETTWLDRIHEDYRNENPDSIWYLYTTSLHWSLTQFTPASMEVVPQNTTERCYNLLIIIIGVVAFSSLISSITGAMTYMRIINQETTKMNAALQEFFIENDITQDLASRIWHCRPHEIRRAEKMRLMTDLSVFNTLPDNLRHDLLCELYVPKVSLHPMFFKLNYVDADALGAICAFGIEYTDFADVQEQYQRGKTMLHMFFVLEGVLEYSISSIASVQEKVVTDTKQLSSSMSSIAQTNTVQSNQWACEVALWLARVKFRGGFHAKGSNPQLLQVSAKGFKEVAAQNPVALVFLSKYAQKFCQAFITSRRMQHEVMLNDDSKKEVLQQICRKAFHEVRQDIVRHGLVKSKKSFKFLPGNTSRFKHQIDNEA